MPITREQASEAFQKASRDIPEITQGRKLVSIGNFGLVLADDCDVITKVLFRHQEDYWNELSKEHAGNELITLRALTSNPLDGIETPVLLSEPKILHHSDYSAFYQMSRLSGNSMLWYPMENEVLNSERLRRDGIIAGRALAKFHSAASTSISKVDLPAANPIKLGAIHTSENLPDRFNIALEKADQYLQERKTLGIIHGDYHGGNILVDQSSGTVGLIDFGFTGYANLYYDFIKAKPHFMPGLIEGYEQETCVPVDRQLIAATILGRYTSRLSKLDDKATADNVGERNVLERLKVKKVIVDCLNDMREIIGQSF